MSSSSPSSAQTSAPPAATHATAPEDIVPARAKLIYGAACMSDNLMANAVHQLANPIYNLVLGVSPAVIGAVLAIGRLLDAFIDPVIGNLSDNFRSRFGRRRPFIVLGSLAAGLAFWLMFMMPRGWSVDGYTVYFIVAALLYFPAYAAYSIARAALGIELTRDYHERTRLSAAAALVMPFGGIIAVWLFALTKLDVFADNLAGARWTTFGFLLFVGAIGVLVARSLEEKGYAQATRQEKLPLRTSVAMTLRCRPLLLIAGATLALLLGIFTVYSLALYLNIYYVYGGDAKRAAVLHGAVGTAAQIANIAAAPVVWFFAPRFGRKRTLLTCLSVTFVGTFSKWFCITPAAPWLMFVPMVLMGFGMGGFWALSSAMLADVCDHDELTNGYRREAMIGAVNSWLFKTGGSLAYFLSGLVLVWTGFSEKLGGAQAPETIFGMRALFAFVPAVCTAVAIVCIWAFPITEETAQATRRALDARRSRAERDPVAPVEIK